MQARARWHASVGLGCESDPSARWGTSPTGGFHLAVAAGGERRWIRSAAGPTAGPRRRKGKRGKEKGWAGPKEIEKRKKRILG